MRQHPVFLRKQHPVFPMTLLIRHGSKLERWEGSAVVTPERYTATFKDAPFLFINKDVEGAVMIMGGATFSTTMDMDHATISPHDNLTVNGALVSAIPPEPPQFTCMWCANPFPDITTLEAHEEECS